MKWTTGTIRNILVSVSVILIVLVLQGCAIHKKAQLGSHKITVSRHEICKQFGVEEHGDVSIFRYRGVGPSARFYEVTINKNRVMLNGLDLGALRDGDSVRITDNGIGVNSLNYDQSAQYLKGNAEALGDVNNAAARAEL
jgi:hypothetical protein